MRRPRVVDDDIEAAIGCQREFDQALDVGILRDIAAAEARSTTGFHDVLDRVLSILGIEIVDDDLCALGGETLRNAATEPGARTRDDGNLVLQSHFSEPYPCLSTTVLSAVNPYSASRPFSRPCPECFTPPNGNSTPPPAP